MNETKINYSPNYLYSINHLILYSIVLLIIAHFSIISYFPNPIIWGTAVAILILIIFAKFLAKNNNIGFLIIMLICNHFAYAANQGGLFNFVAIVSILIKLVLSRELFKFNISNFLLSIIIILFVINLLTTIFFNTGTIAQMLYGLIAFTSFLSFFLIAAAANWVNLFKILITSLTFLSVYNTIVVLNQRFFGIYIESPIFPLVVNIPGYTSTNASGTIGTSAIMGEFYAIFVVLLSAIYFFKHKNLNINTSMLIIGMACSLINAVLSNSRSATIIIIVGYIVIFFILFSKHNVSRIFRFVFISLVLLTAIFSSGLGSSLTDKFSLIDVNSLTISGVASGEEINRGWIFEGAFVRLATQSWWMGEGYGVFETNATTWFGVAGFSISGEEGDVIYDIHSLYLGLPMLFGWIGAFLFILVFLIVIRILFSSLKYSKTSAYYGLNVGLLLFWIFFLINEYKVNSLFLPNYQAIIWILLGFSYSFAKNIKYHNV